MARLTEQHPDDRTPAEKMPDLLEIVGQDRAIAQLELGLVGPRRPHAYLFSGPDGVGRRTTAAAMAKTLLCENPVQRPNAGRFPELPEDMPVVQACNACTDCRMMAAGSHGDFNIIYKELAAYHEDSSVRDRVMQELGIEVIRSFLIAPAGRRSMRGRGKVFVILDAELMSIAAQNALLKTLEEPPPGVTIILIAEQAEQLLPTTLSRCSLVKFQLLGQDFVIDKLRRQGMDEAQAQFWAAFTGGSLGRSIELAKRGLFQVKRGMLDRLAGMNQAGDAELGDELAKQTDTLADEQVKATRTGQTELSKSLAVRQVAGIMFELIASAFSDAITLASQAQRPLVNADQRQTIATLANKFDLIQLATIIEQLSEFERLLWRNVNSKTIWDNVVITCASASPLTVGD